MTSVPIVVRTKANLRQKIAEWRKTHKSIGLVPTMGALHAGHLSLVHACRNECDFTIVTIFVNPTQFGPNEDFDAYPRQEKEDLKKLEDSGVSLVYIPSAAEMYSEAFDTVVQVGGDMTHGLCGASRPGHFDGVTTVVLKLLLQALPDKAFFGEKDFQQLQVIKKMANDLDVPVEIHGVPIFREDDGLAMSSRNAYLSKTEREVAPKLYQQLGMIKKQILEGRSVDKTLVQAIEELEVLGFKVDYLDLKEELNLQNVTAKNGKKVRIFVAAWLGKTRLIDNLQI